MGPFSENISSKLFQDGSQCGQSSPEETPPDKSHRPDPTVSEGNQTRGVGRRAEVHLPR